MKIMKTKIYLLIILFFLIILIGNVCFLNLIKRNYIMNSPYSLVVNIKENNDKNYRTYYALTMNMGYDESDIQHINENYEFYKLRLENDKLKYYHELKILLTINIIILLAVLTMFRLRKHQLEINGTKK